MTLIPDARLTYAEANYLVACALMVQKSDPLYASDVVLSQARDKLLASCARHFREHPEDILAHEAEMLLQRQLREEDASDRHGD